MKLLFPAGTFALLCAQCLHLREVSFVWCKKWVVHLHETQPVEVENSALLDLDRVVEFLPSAIARDETQTPHYASRWVSRI